MYYAVIEWDPQELISVLWRVDQETKPGLSVLLSGLLNNQHRNTGRKWTNLFGAKNMLNYGLKRQ